MFTGLVDRLGQVRRIASGTAGGRLVVGYAPWSDPVQRGESIAVQGACLTVAELSNDELAFDVLSETFALTNLGGKRAGDLVNLERALKADGRFGGHIVTGHVDGMGRVAAITPVGRDWKLDIGCPGDLLDGMVVKGSIAVDGVSLTITEIRGDAFAVHLIPHTWRHTSLHSLQVGEPVNLETDMMGKYVRKYLAARGGASPLGMDDLAAAGFV